MRKIAFRAFVRADKTMHYVKLMGGGYCWLDDVWIDRDTNLQDTAHEIGVTCDIMQFTGLTDSTNWAELTDPEREAWVRSGRMPSDWKGKEIYEGDIFVCEGGYEVPEGETEHNEPMKVVFKEGQWVAECLCGCSDEYPLYECDIDHIIGNIYENAELMEEKQ